MGDYVRELLVSARSLAHHLKTQAKSKSRQRDIVRRFQRSSIVAHKSDFNKTILFFSPEAGVAPHYVAQCVLARTLKELGHNVLFAKCFQIFERCPVMDMHQLSYRSGEAAKTETCVNCAANSIEMLDTYGLDSLDLRSILIREVTLRHQRAIANLPDDLSLFEYDSIPFGKLCLNDMALATKVSNFEEVSQEIRLAWLQYIKSSLLSYLLIDHVCQKFSISRVLHFNDYSLLLGARMAARKNGVPTFTVTLASHNVIDRRRYVILPDIVWASFGKQEEAWPTWRGLHLSAQQVHAVADDLIVRFGAKSFHTYSPAKTFKGEDVRSSLGLTKDKKLLVAYTSSLDEMLAGKMLRRAFGLDVKDRQQPFKDQIEWLQSLIDFVRKREDLELVVRVHPREGVNKRDAVSSMHLARLRRAFDRPLGSCRFVWPGERVSSYDLAEAADLVLTSWSTIGLELARLGSPVLTSTNGVSPFPQDDFLEWGETPRAYFDKLEALLQRPTRLETIALAFRWYHLFHLGTSLDLGDIVPTHDFEGLPSFKLPREAAAIEEVICGDKEVLALNLERLRESQHPDSAEEEKAALERQLRRMIHFLHTGEDSSEDFQLRLMASDERANDSAAHSNGKLAAKAERTLITNGPHTHYLVEGMTYSRFSPMSARLAPLCAQQLLTPFDSAVT